MKKIFFILPSIGFGGAEKVYIEIASALNRSNLYEVELLYLTKRSKERVLPDDLKFKCFNASSTKSAFFNVLKYLKSNKPDIVFSSHTHLNIMLILMKKLYKLPFKLFVRQTFNLSNIQEYSAIKRKINLLFHKIYKYADGIIFQSNFMYHDFTKFIPLSNCYVISNPVNVKEMLNLSNEYVPKLKNKEIKRNYLFVGRLVEIKNVDYLINSFSKYSNKESSKLLIMGDGPEKEKLNKLIAKLNLQPFINILDAKENPFPYIKKSDALFLCSKSEGFPNVLLEALGLNTPVFVRRHIGGTEEVLRNLNLFEYFLEEIDFNKIDVMLESYPKNLNQRVINHYGIDIICEKYIKLIEK